MRIVCLTNFYPPLSRGGYEQWCCEAVEYLRDHGHEILVLTSRFHSNGKEKPEPEWIIRKLHLEMELVSFRNSFRFFFGRQARERENVACLESVVAKFAPDAIVMWGMWNLARSLAARAEQLLPGRVVYYLGDYWPTLSSQYEYYWQAPGRTWVSRLPKHLLGLVARRKIARERQPELVFDHALFPSAFLRDELIRLGVQFHKTEIIPGGVDTRPFAVRSTDHSVLPGPNHRLSLLYVGRLEPEKGVHTAIEAISILVRQRGTESVRLQIVGGGEPAYEERLHELVRRNRLEAVVAFLGPQSLEAIRDLYCNADVLLFTSIWQEPFGRVLVEAMAAGTVVIGTATGGAGEILIKDENALLFTPADAVGLMTQISRLADSPTLGVRLAAAGRVTAEKFDISRMASGIENYLREELR